MQPPALTAEGTELLAPFFAAHAGLAAGPPPAPQGQTPAAQPNTAPPTPLPHGGSAAGLPPAAVPLTAAAQQSEEEYLEEDGEEEWEEGEEEGTRHDHSSSGGVSGNEDEDEGEDEDEDERTDEAEGQANGWTLNLGLDAEGNLPAEFWEPWSSLSSDRPAVEAIDPPGAAVGASRPRLGSAPPEPPSAPPAPWLAPLRWIGCCRRRSTVLDVVPDTDPHQRRSAILGDGRRVWDWLDPVRAREIAAAQGGHVSAEDLVTRLGWTAERAGAALTHFVDNGVCWIDTQDPSSDMVYWFPSIALADRGARGL